LWRMIVSTSIIFLNASSGLPVLVHDYLGIRLERIWEIIERDLPGFRATLEAIRTKIEK
jgi:hypothetical protein